MDLPQVSAPVNILTHFSPYNQPLLIQFFYCCLFSIFQMLLLFQEEKEEACQPEKVDQPHPSSSFPSSFPTFLSGGQFLHQGASTGRYRWLWKLTIMMERTKQNTQQTCCTVLNLMKDTLWFYNWLKLVLSCVTHYCYEAV